MKSWKSLLVPALILAVLVVFLILALFLHKNSDNPTGTSASDSATAVNIYSYQAGDIKSIRVLKKDGSSYALVSSGSVSGISGIWGYQQAGKDAAGFTFSQTALAGFVKEAVSCDAVRRIDGEKAALSEYGLDKPAFTVTFILLSGEEHTLFIGSETYDGKAAYCTFDQTGSVYLINVNTAQIYDKLLLDFLDLTITSIKYTEVASVSFRREEDSLNLSASVKKYPGISTEDSSDETKASEGTSYVSGWEFTNPFDHRSSEKFNALITSVLSLSASSCAALNQEDNGKYGLDKPAYTFSINLTNGKTIQIYLSGNNGGVLYCSSSQSGQVFSIDSSAVTGLQTPLTELIYPYLNEEIVSDVKNIEAVFPEGSFEIQMDIAENLTIADKSSKAVINGLDAKVYNKSQRSYFDLLFESISNMSISGLDFDSKPLNTKDITIIITNKNNTQTIINLAVKDKNTYYAFRDGVYQGFLVAKDEIYSDNGIVLNDYGIWAAYQRLIEAIDGKDSSGVYEMQN